MDEKNKTLLEELIQKELEYLKDNPNNDAAIDRLNILCQLSTADYAAASKAYSEEIKANAEAEKMQEEIAIRREELEAEEARHQELISVEEAKLELQKKQGRLDTIIKAVRAAGGIIVPVCLIHADRIGEFVNKAAVTLSTRLFDRD